MLFRLREIIRNLLIRFFMATTNNLEMTADHSFSPEGYTQTHIVNSTIITMFQKGEDVRFFRECCRHRSLKDCLLYNVEDYFDRISKCNQRQELKRSVLADLENVRNYKRITGISGIFESDLIDILSGQYKDYSAAGVPCFHNFDQQEEFLAFIKYINGVINNQKINAYLSKGIYENYSANKLLATYHLAQLLGVSSLIIPVQVCSFQDGNLQRLGIMTGKAPGFPPSEITPQQRTVMNVPAFLKDITNLEYLDALCYQLDHRLDNYYVVEDTNGLISHIVTFDNDAARTFFVRGKLPRGTYAGCSGVIGADGAVSRPYMDKALADALLSCKKKDLHALADFMSSTQLLCLWKRIRQLQDAIEKSVSENPGFLVEDWQTADPEKENFPGTYFHLYLTDTLMLDRAEQFRQLREDKKN